jgi:DNA polymerase (family 10)
MHNDTIAANFSLLSKLMDIHGENSFKSKSYASAAFAIDKLTTQLAEMPPEKIYAIKGIGDAIGKKIIDQLQTGEFSLLNELIKKTPPGIIEMLSIKGIGPKKIATIWKELEIESLGELLYACNENRLTLYKGFGEKSQQNIKEAIEFYMGTLGRYLFAQIEIYALEMEKKLKNAFPEKLFFSTGAFRRQLEIIDVLDWVTTATESDLQQFFTSNDFVVIEQVNNYFTCKGKDNVTLGFYCIATEQVYAQLFTTSCSEQFLTEWNARHPINVAINYPSEEAIFTAAGINFIPAFQREDPSIIDLAKHTISKAVIQPADIKGIVHSHSNWSDGAHTLEEMAMGAIEQGYRYLVITQNLLSMPMVFMKKEYWHNMLKLMN